MTVPACMLARWPRINRRGYGRALVKMSAMLSLVLMGWMSMIAVSTSSRSLSSLTAWCL